MCIGWSTLGSVSVNEAPPWDASPCIKHKAYDKNIFMNYVGSVIKIDGSDLMMHQLIKFFFWIL